MKVYLAGGMTGMWRDRVRAAVPHLSYIDPRQHELTEERAYTAWDLAGVRGADLVFAYLGADNPSGYGLCVEVGYAAALGTPVLFVDEKRLPAFGMVRAIAAATVPTLDEGIALLRVFGRLL